MLIFKSVIVLKIYSVLTKAQKLGLIVNDRPPIARRAIPIAFDIYPLADDVRAVDEL